jgi:hypothetical protein
MALCQAEGSNMVIFLAQDETNSYTNVSFFGHELWPVQENGDIRECTCECMDVPLIQISLFRSVLNLQQNAK